MKYGLSLMGYGGVNRALVQIINDKGQQLKAKYGFEVSVISVSDIFLGYACDEDGLDITALVNLPAEKGALAGLSGGSEKADNDAAILATGVDIVVEATYTNPTNGEPAVSHCRTALANNRHIVTTNKGPVALFGNELGDIANDKKLSFEFEGTVMSGTPVLRFANETLKGCEITGFRGILNGTANYILGQVEAGVTMENAIKEAQELGYAEADPTADIEGFDVMLKVVILANQLLDADIGTGDVIREGITSISEEQIRAARKNGQRWKLIGQASRGEDGELKASVTPQCIAEDDPLAGINGPTNAIAFETDLLGTVMASGPGAGRIETGFALLADIIAIHNSLNIEQKRAG